MKRPVLRWHGGKYRLREWVISHFPPHNVYVEPFGGAASVLLSKRPSRIEVYNDANAAVVNLFRLLRDPDLSAKLKAQLELTPFSREEHRRSWEPSDDPVESARRFIVRSFQSFGAKADSEHNGWRTRTSKAIWSPCATWKGWPESIPAFTSRLMDTIIECNDWRRVFTDYDDSDVLFYVDPPYPMGTRTGGHRKTYGVAYEMTDADHEELCRRLLTVKGYVVLSSYRNPIYDEILAGWTVDTTRARAQCNSPRVEALYLSPRTVSATQQPLLEVA